MPGFPTAKFVRVRSVKPLSAAVGLRLAPLPKLALLICTARQPAFALEFFATPSLINCSDCVAHRVTGQCARWRLTVRCASWRKSTSRSSRALSLLMLSRIWDHSRSNSILRLLSSKIVSSTPSPCLLPVRSCLTPPSKSLVTEVDFGASCVHFSPCGQ